MPGYSNSVPGMFASGLLQFRRISAMKPSTQAIAALAIAVISGTGGYWIGKGQVAPVAARGETNAGPLGVKNPPERSAPAIDLEGLRARLDAEKNPLRRFKLAQQSMEAWVDRNPKGALDWLLGQQPTEQRNEMMRIALDQFAENDAKGAADWAVKNLSGIDLNNSLIAIAESWAEQNGTEAANWFLALPQSQQRDAAIENMLFAWASNEPEAALQYLKTNPAIGELSPTLQRAALAGWAKSDPQQAVSTSLALSQAGKDPGLFANTLANWATMDLQGSSDWLLANLKGGDERMAAVQELATIYAQQSPDSGVAWLEKLTAGSERDAAASSLVAGWARADAAAAAKWATSQTLGTLSPDATSAVIQNFMRENPEAFEKWKATLPEGPLKNQAGQLASPEGQSD